MSLAMPLAQLARILGPEVRERLGLPASVPFPDQPAPETEGRIRELAATHAGALARALAAEASASDDVQDAVSATAYLEDRLRFFGPLLSEETRRQVRQRFAEATRQWAAEGR